MSRTDGQLYSLCLYVLVCSATLLSPHTLYSLCSGLCRDLEQTTSLICPRLWRATLVAAAARACMIEYLSMVHHACFCNKQHVAKPYRRLRVRYVSTARSSFTSDHQPSLIQRHTDSDTAGPQTYTKRAGFWNKFSAQKWIQLLALHCRYLESTVARQISNLRCRFACPRNFATPSSATEIRSRSEAGK